MINLDVRTDHVLQTEVIPRGPGSVRAALPDGSPGEARPLVMVRGHLGRLVVQRSNSAGVRDVADAHR
jgi:hypothetical protein